MDSNIANELGSRFHPVVFLRTDTKPENAMQPRAGMKSGCVMPYFAQAAVKGRTAVFDRDTFLCAGASSGLCFGRAYDRWLPGGIDTFAAFFSHGLASAKDPELYEKVISFMPEKRQEMFRTGECMHYSQEIARKFIEEQMPNYDLPEKYAVYKPLAELKDDEVPLSVIFTVNPVQMSALMHLAGALPDGNGMACTSRASACQAIGSEVVRQGEKDVPNAVLGLTDLAGRLHSRNLIPNEYLTYAVPWKMFLAMDASAKENSIFQSHVWKELNKSN
ncbi:hypothetical protein McpSp1_07570 [Methanocorpusculaceae archaeon Sp1]|nr:hypothetical protein [Methanocorpusculaceae archaeon Sp1]